MCLHRGTFGGGAGPCYLQSAQLSAADSTGFVRHNRLLGEAEEEVGVGDTIIIITIIIVNTVWIGVPLFVLCGISFSG